MTARRTLAPSQPQPPPDDGSDGQRRPSTCAVSGTSGVRRINNARAGIARAAGAMNPVRAACKMAGVRPKPTKPTTPTSDEKQRRQGGGDPPEQSFNNNRMRRPPPNAIVFWDATIKKGIKGMRDEFLQKIHRYSPPNASVEAFKANMAKNRYPDVTCLDGTRVVLAGVEGGCDYIHANWLSVNHGPAALVGGSAELQNIGTEFICTQGPKPETISDFWHMIWQEEIVCIVMLCAIMEENRRKCEQYWPENKDDTRDYGAFSITHVSNERSYLAGGNECRITTLEIMQEGCAPRTVKHLQWTEWADRSVPNDCRAILKLRKRLITLAEGRPVVVHCSAGIGRTGTLASVDLAMATLDAAREVDIVAIVRRVRDQRLHAVQTPQQYAAVYKSIVDYIRARGQSQTL